MCNLSNNESIDCKLVVFLVLLYTLVVLFVNHEIIIIIIIKSTDGQTLTDGDRELAVR